MPTESLFRPLAAAGNYQPDKTPAPATLSCCRREIIPA
jgi:hypothetical protein